jgi:hypothetical protein
MGEGALAWTLRPASEIRPAMLWGDVNPEVAVGKSRNIKVGFFEASSAPLAGTEKHRMEEAFWRF